jgi:hypothetical protein
MPDLHLIPGLWTIDGYGKIAARLQETLDLTPGQNYFDFAYDWRRDNRVAARALARATHDWLSAWRASSGNADAKLILVGHSMGGLVCRYFLECLDGWKDTRLLVTFGTPYRGSANALGFLANGMAKKLLGLTVADLSPLLRSFTSVYQLLPIYPCYDGGDGTLARVAEADGVPNVDRARAADALAFHREIEAAVDGHLKDQAYLDAHYEILPIVGTFQPTNHSGVRRGDAVEMLRTIGGTDPDGDSTVPLPSATPLELSEDPREMYANERHGSLQNNDGVLVQLMQRVMRDQRSLGSFKATMNMGPRARRGRRVPAGGAGLAGGDPRGSRRAAHRRGAGRGQGDRGGPEHGLDRGRRLAPDGDPPTPRGDLSGHRVGRGTHRSRVGPVRGAGRRGVTQEGRPAPLPVRWIHGAPSSKHDSDPEIQVFEFDPRTFILRQNMSVHYEAPFLFVFVGEERAILVDTGATADPRLFPLRAVVDGIVGPGELLVLHTHSHGDHVAGDGQFADRPRTSVVGAGRGEVVAFHGFDRWPEGTSVGGPRGPDPGRDPQPRARRRSGLVLRPGDRLPPVRRHGLSGASLCPGLGRVRRHHRPIGGLCRRAPRDARVGVPHRDDADARGATTRSEPRTSPTSRRWR